MTDAKGAGEGPYTLKLIDNGYKTEVVYGPTFNSYCIADFTGSGLVFALNAAHAAGRKAERERCLDIVLDGYPSTVDIAEIQKRIRGGQNAK